MCGCTTQSDKVDVIDIMMFYSSDNDNSNQTLII